MHMFLRGSGQARLPSGSRAAINAAYGRRSISTTATTTATAGENPYSQQEEEVIDHDTTSTAGHAAATQHGGRNHGRYSTPFQKQQSSAASTAGGGEGASPSIRRVSYEKSRLSTAGLAPAGECNQRPATAEPVRRTSIEGDAALSRSSRLPPPSFSSVPSTACGSASITSGSAGRNVNGLACVRAQQSGESRDYGGRGSSRSSSGIGAYKEPGVTRGGGDGADPLLARSGDAVIDSSRRGLQPLRAVNRKKIRSDRATVRASSSSSSSLPSGGHRRRRRHRSKPDHRYDEEIVVFDARTSESGGEHAPTVPTPCTTGEVRDRDRDRSEQQTRPAASKRHPQGRGEAPSTFDHPHRTEAGTATGSRSASAVATAGGGSSWTEWRRPGEVGELDVHADPVYASRRRVAGRGSNNGAVAGAGWGGNDQV